MSVRLRNREEVTEVSRTSGLYGVFKGSRRGFIRLLSPKTVRGAGLSGTQAGNRFEA